MTLRRRLRCPHCIAMSLVRRSTLASDHATYIRMALAPCVGRRDTRIVTAMGRVALLRIVRMRRMAYVHACNACPACSTLDMSATTLYDEVHAIWRSLRAAYDAAIRRDLRYLGILYKDATRNRAAIARMQRSLTPRMQFARQYFRLALADKWT